THPGLYHHVWLPDEELTEMSGLSQPTVSHHLKRLTEAGLLDQVRVGRTVTHQVRPELFAELRTVLQLDGPTTDEKETITHVTSKHFEAIIIGGGQAGLSTAYYLLRAGVDTLVLDDQEGTGGAWRHVWPSMTLFSTAEFSSLPGKPMPAYEG